VNTMERKRTKLDWAVLVVVIGAAVLVIASSFSNTTKLAELLGMHPFLTAGTVEIAFTTFLFLRGRQRAFQLNVPLFLDVLYFGLLGLVTGVNMWGLSIENQEWGLVMGGSISFLLWGMETTLVWLWTKSHEPHRKTIREIEREADREIKEEEAMQRIQWKRHEARQPSLALIKMVRKQEEKRKRVETGISLLPWKKEAKGLPAYFLREPEPTPVIEAEPVSVDVQEPETAAEIVPLKKRTIGFHAELSNTEHRTSNTENQAPVSIEQDRTLSIEHPPSDIKTVPMTKTEQAIQYVMELIEQNQKFTVSSVANAVGCARSTASVAIREAREKMAK
jgi:hypothetical protein